MKVAIYARYSSDNQRDASIADQLRVCREFAARQGWTVVEEFTDHAISGATLLRAGFQALMRDALKWAIRRCPRRSAGSIQPRSRGYCRAFQTSHLRRREHRHAHIPHLHVGLKGTMNALFLKDLTDKTQRGLRGRVELGKSGGGLC